MQSARTLVEGVTSIFTPALKINKKKQQATDDALAANAVAVERRLVAKPPWFKAIFNFDETTDWDATFDNFSMENDYLLCNIANQDKFKRQFVGLFECLSLAQLKDKLDIEKITIKEGLSFNHIIANVTELHYNPVNTGAVFQAASQFNCLEMFNEYFTPKDGVAIYELDPTQGPACALACPAALVYRNYLVKHKNNIVQPNTTKDDDVNTGQHPVQIDNLEKLGTVVENSSSTYWTMENGYAFLRSRAKLLELNAKLYDVTMANSAMEALCVGVHWETSVNPSRVTKPHNVCQVYASALPIKYTNPRFILADTEEAVESEWEPFSRLILNASYEATLAVAAKKSMDNKSTRIKCFLTLLGGGAFENKKVWIEDAIKTAILKYKDWPIDVILVHRSKIEQDTYGWSNKIIPIEVEAVRVKLETELTETPRLELQSESESETPRLELQSKSVSTPLLGESKLTPLTPLLITPGSCPINNRSISCWANAAIQLLWNIDGVRDFLINSDKINTSRKSIYDDLNFIYPEQTSYKAAALKEVAELLIGYENTHPIDEEFMIDAYRLRAEERAVQLEAQKLLHRNTFRALSKLFITINSSNKSTVLRLEDLMFDKIDKDSKTTGEESIRRQLDNWFETKEPGYLDQTTGEAGRQADSSQFLTILDIIKDFMNIESLNMFKSYNIKNTETRECSNQNDTQNKPQPNSVRDHFILLTMDSASLASKDNITISSLLAKEQLHREITDSNPAKSDTDSCFPGGRILYEQTKYDRFDEGISLIISLKRTDSVPTFSNDGIMQYVEHKELRSVTPDKVLTFNDENYTLQGCIIHIGKSANYGHYIYIIYDATGEPKEIIDDGHKFNRESEDGNYGKAKYIEDINLINTNGYVFLYKNLAKMQQIADIAATIAKPFIEHAIERVDRLRYQLSKPRVTVLIAGSNGKHNLGTGLAKLQWLQHYVNDYPINVIISAQRLFVEKLDELFKELERQYPSKVLYHEKVTKANANVNNIVVWGANYSNCYGEIDEKIKGDGQARDMVSHGDGVFGIITTPLFGIPPVIPDLVKGFGRGPSAVRGDRGARGDRELAAGIAASLASYAEDRSSTSTSINYTTPSAYGQNTSKSHSTIAFTSGKGYHRTLEDIRMLILNDTITKFQNYYQSYLKFARDNLAQWESKAKEIKDDKLVTIANFDWGDAALIYTRQYGKTFACLNMASAIYPGGSYNLGGSGQEENMFRRTNCHFTVNREQLQQIPKEALTSIENSAAYDQAYWHYNPYQKDLIEGKGKLVYLDKDNPRICIKGAETVSPDLGYSDLEDNEIFSFYEMRCAPLDRRNSLPPMRDMTDDTKEIKKRIKAIFNTLKTAEIKHVILGDFGCGKLMNNPFTIANIYKEVIAAESTHFEKIVITIPNAEYNKTIYDAFVTVFSDETNKFAEAGGLNDTRTPLKKDEDKCKEIAEEFLMLARDRINELRNILKTRPTAKVTIACMDNIGNKLGFASGSSTPLWTTKYNDPKNQEGDTSPIGESARKYFIGELRKLFNSLKGEKDHDGRISYGNISEITPSLDHYVVWSAYTDTYESTLERVITSESFSGGQQAAALTPHKVGLFGIIAAPGIPLQEA
jgi:hypothetical protein